MSTIMITYGEFQYPDKRNLHKPNVVIGRSEQGDWVDGFNKPSFMPSPEFAAIEGYTPIGEYVETALERFESTTDIQAGLVAIQILHHFHERFGDTTPRMHHDMVAALLDNTHADAQLFIHAGESHPEIAASLRAIMKVRASQHTSIVEIASDRQLVAYIEASADGESLDQSLAQLLAMRRP